MSARAWPHNRRIGMYFVARYIVNICICRYANALWSNVLCVVLAERCSGLWEGAGLRIGLSFA